MDLAKIKELKIMLDRGVLSQDDFSSLKKKVINGEDVNIDDYSQGQDSIASNQDDGSVMSDSNYVSSRESSQVSENIDNYKRKPKWQQQ